MLRNGTDNEMLYRAVLTLRTAEECAAFFADLCTVTEINALSQRLEVAKQLSRGRVYNKIAESTGASSATVSRVNRCLVHGAGGYKTVLGRLGE